jgi:hypothetical protein
MEINIEDLQKFLDFRKKVNNEHLEDIKWVFNGKRVKIPKKEIKFWNYTGLNNLDFGKDIVIPITAKTSENWKKQIEPLMKIIRKVGHVTEEALRYETQVIKGLSAKDFSKVHNIVWSNNLKTEVEGCLFPKSYVDYDGIRFYMMSGQGTAIWCERIKK